MPFVMEEKAVSITPAEKIHKESPLELEVGTEQPCREGAL